MSLPQQQHGGGLANDAAGRPGAAAAAAAARTASSAASRFAVTCLVLGRPPSSAFIVNCGDGSLPLAGLVSRLEDILCRPSAAAGGARRELLVFQVLRTGAAGDLTLASPILDPAAAAGSGIAKFVEKPGVGMADTAGAGVEMRAHALATLLGGRCVWVTGDLLRAAVRDVVIRPAPGSVPPTISPDVNDTDDAGTLDFLVLVDESAAAGDATAGHDLPAYADIVGFAPTATRPVAALAAPAVLPEKVVASAQTSRAAELATALAAVSGPARAAISAASAALREAPPVQPPQPPPPMAVSQAASFESTALPPLAGGDQPLLESGGAAVFDVKSGIPREQKAGAKRRRALLLLFVALAVVVVVLAVAVPVGVVMSNRKAASSSAADSSSGNGGAGSGASASSSAGASASSGVTAMSASGDGATTSSTADSASSSTSSSVSSDALVASSATASTATSAPTTSTATASSSSCSQTQVDAFTSSTNLLGFTTGDDGTMKSLSRSSGQLVFVPTSSSYFYESLRNDDGGSSSTCGAAVTPFNYLVFTITGSGSAEVDIKTGCSENDHYTSSFAVSSSAATYAVDVEATVGSSALAADVSAFTWESFKLSSSSAQWTVTGVYFVNDLSACGISATVIS